MAATDLPNSLMKEAQRRHDDFRRNSMQSAIESEEARQDVDLQMRSINNMARRDSIGYNGMYGRGIMGHDPHMMRGLMNGMGMLGGHGLGGMNMMGMGMGGLGSTADSLAFESALAPFGGMGLGGQGIYGMSSYDLAMMHGHAPVLGMGPYGVSPMGYAAPPYSKGMNPYMTPHHHHHRRLRHHAAVAQSLAMGGTGCLPMVGGLDPLVNPMAVAGAPFIGGDLMASRLVGGVF